MTVAERYFRATVSDDLRMTALEQKDADRLVAAAYASGGCPWKLSLIHI